MQKITLTNDFHNAEVNLRVRALWNGVELEIPSISKSQAAKARRSLCGIADCTCGGAFGQRGNQFAYRKNGSKVRLVLPAWAD